MKKWITSFALLPAFIFQGTAQEMAIDSIDKSKFIGVMQGGEMGQFVFVPYFSTNKADKNNFIIRQLNGQTFTEEQVQRFELPATYTLKAATFNGTSYLLYFYDEAKKEDIFISTTAGNINKKKTIKASGDTYVLSGNGTPEEFLIVAIGPKGNYTAEQVSTNLESKWKKQFTPPSGVNREIITVKQDMGRLQVIRKDTKGGKDSKAGSRYEFSAHYLQMDSGEDMAEVPLVSGDIKFYPTFFSEKEGMNFTGGYYFTEGIYKAKPEGIFFAQLSPEGRVQQSAKVPYSQVIEDLKSTVGSQLASENTAIILTGGYLSHETQSFILAGQIITRQDKEGGTVVEFGDFVTVKFSIDEQFKEAVSTPSGNGRVEIKGNTSSINTYDLGTWLSKSSLLPFSHFINAPGNPLIAYRTREKNGQVNICYRTIGIKNDTTKPECMLLFREIQAETPYSFTGNLAVTPIHYSNILPSAHDIGNLATFELNKSMLVITRIPAPRLDMLMRPVRPEHVAPDDIEHPHHEPEEKAEQ